MENFEKIVDNIQKELLMLKEINDSLRAENNSLREKLGMSDVTENENDELDSNISLYEAYDRFFILDDRSGRKSRMAKCFTHAGYHKLKDFEGKCMQDIVSVRQAGIVTCAVLIVLLEHYHVNINISLETARGYSMQSRIKKIYEEISQIREKMVFQE